MLRSLNSCRLIFAFSQRATTTENLRTIALVGHSPNLAFIVRLTRRNPSLTECRRKACFKFLGYTENLSKKVVQWDDGYVWKVTHNKPYPCCSAGTSSCEEEVEQQGEHSWSKLMRSSDGDKYGAVLEENLSVVSKDLRSLLFSRKWHNKSTEGLFISKHICVILVSDCNATKVQQKKKTWTLWKGIYPVWTYDIL